MSFRTAQKAAMILVVDDDPDVLDLAVMVLRDEGYRVVSASDATAALAVLRATPEIDLLFTDIAMPGGKDGFDLAHEAKHLRPELRVLYTSGFVKDMSRAEGTCEHGRMLAKPWRPRQLVAAVCDALT